MSEYSKEFLEDVGPCYFPALNDSGPPTGNTSTTEVFVHTPHVTRMMMQLCLLEGISPHAIFQLAWALVLHCYDSTGSICFAYFCSENDFRSNRILDNDNLLTGLLVRCARLTNDSTINRLRELQANFDSRESRRLQSLVENGQMNIPDKQMFNTAVLVNQRPHSSSLVTRDPFASRKKTNEVSGSNVSLSILWESAPNCM